MTTLSTHDTKRGEDVRAGVEDEESLESEAARLAAAGFSLVGVAVQRELLGVIACADAPRAEAAAVVAALQARGIGVWIASGDNEGAGDVASSAAVLTLPFGRAVSELGPLACAGGACAARRGTCARHPAWELSALRWSAQELARVGAMRGALRA